MPFFVYFYVIFLSYLYNTPCFLSKIHVLNVNNVRIYKKISHFSYVPLLKKERKNTTGHFRLVVSVNPIP